MNTTLLLQLTSLTYLGLVAAGLLMPRVVGLRENIRSLPKFIRQLFWVYYTFIGLCLVSFGLGTFFLADELASGTPLARAVCGFLAVFWSVRFVAGTFVFDLRPYLTSNWRRAGLFATNLVFTALPFIYGWAALKGVKP
jgi:hypothetical protein